MKLQGLGEMLEKLTLLGHFKAKIVSGLNRKCVGVSKTVVIIRTSGSDYVRKLPRIERYGPLLVRCGKPIFFELPEITGETGIASERAP